MSDPLNQLTGGTDNLGDSKGDINDAIESLDPNWLGGGSGGEGIPDPADPGVILVSKTLGNRPGFNTVQDAIDGTNPINGASGAAEGDLIFIEQGTYEERPVIDKLDDVTVRGEDQDDVVIDASDDKQFTNSYGFAVNADGVTLDSFTLKGPVQPQSKEEYPESYFGLKISGCENFILEDVNVKGSTLSEIDLNSVNGAELLNVTADGANTNAGATSGTGIFLTNCVDIQMEGVTTRNNTWGGIGVSAWSGNYPTPNPTARGIHLSGTNKIEDSPPLYTEEVPKDNPYHTPQNRDNKIDTDANNAWDVRFPINGIGTTSGQQSHDVTDATIDTSDATGKLSHTVVFERSDPPQIGELYFLDLSSAQSAASGLGDSYTVRFVGPVGDFDFMEGEPI